MGTLEDQWWSSIHCDCVYITVKTAKIPAFVQNSMHDCREEWLAWPNINRLHCAGLSNSHYMEKVNYIKWCVFYHPIPNDSFSECLMTRLWHLHCILTTVLKGFNLVGQYLQHALCNNLENRGGSMFPGGGGLKSV